MKGCRACGATELRQVTDLGKLPLAGNFHDGLTAPRYRLAVDHCPGCDFLQVRDTVPHEVLFNSNYCYASSTVPALVKHFEGLAEIITDLLPTDGRVLEIGANDGILSAHLKHRGVVSIGLDASLNVTLLAQERGDVQ